MLRKFLQDWVVALTLVCILLSMASLAHTLGSDKPHKAFSVFTTAVAWGFWINILRRRWQLVSAIHSLDDVIGLLKKELKSRDGEEK